MSCRRLCRSSIRSPLSPLEAGVCSEKAPQSCFDSNKLPDVVVCLSLSLSLCVCVCVCLCVSCWETLLLDRVSVWPCFCACPASDFNFRFGTSDLECRCGASDFRFPEMRRRDSSTAIQAPYSSTRDSSATIHDSATESFKHPRVEPNIPLPAPAIQAPTIRAPATSGTYGRVYRGIGGQGLRILAISVFRVLGFLPKLKGLRAAGFELSARQGWQE